jgi:integrin alpha 7
MVRGVLPMLKFSLVRLMSKLTFNKYLIKINNLDWPYQVGNDKELGKWLLYLEDVPFVEGGGGGSCEVLTPKGVNPLNLMRRPVEVGMMSAALMEEPALLKRTNRSHSFALQYRQKESSVEKLMNESAVLNRVKRDRAMIIRADKLVDNDGKKNNIVTMVRFILIS